MATILQRRDVVRKLRLAGLMMALMASGTALAVDFGASGTGGGMGRSPNELNFLDILAIVQRQVNAISAAQKNAYEEKEAARDSRLDALREMNAAKANQDQAKKEQKRAETAQGNAEDTQSQAELASKNAEVYKQQANSYSYKAGGEAATAILESQGGNKDVYDAAKAAAVDAAQDAQNYADASFQEGLSSQMYSEVAKAQGEISGAALGAARTASEAADVHDANARNAAQQTAIHSATAQKDLQQAQENLTVLENLIKSIDRSKLSDTQKQQVDTKLAEAKNLLQHAAADAAIARQLNTVAAQNAAEAKAAADQAAAARNAAMAADAKANQAAAAAVLAANQAATAFGEAANIAQEATNIVNSIPAYSPSK